MRIDDGQLKWGQMKVLSALGDPGHGISLRELVSKVPTDTDVLDRWVNDLVARGLAVWVDDRAGYHRRVAATDGGFALAMERTHSFLHAAHSLGTPSLVRGVLDASAIGFAANIQKRIARPFGILGNPEGLLASHSQGLSALLAEIHAEMAELDAIDGPARWISALPAEDYRALQRLAQAGGPDEAVAQLVAAAAEPDFLDTIAREAKVTPWVKRSAEVIEEALNAHGDERYALSIPALMPQIEGSIRRLSVERGVADPVEAGLQSDPKRRYKSVRCLIGRLQASGEALFAFFAAYLAERFFDARNEVLHGNNPGYASAELSTECIFAVYELCNGIRDVPSD